VATNTANDLRDITKDSGQRTRIMKVVDINDGIITAMVGKTVAYFKSDLDIKGSDNVIVDEGGIIGTAGRNIPKVFV